MKINLTDLPFVRLPSPPIEVSFFYPENEKLSISTKSANDTIESDFNIEFRELKANQTVMFTEAGNYEYLLGKRVGYIIVDPFLFPGKKDQLNAIRLLSCVPRFLGEFKTWDMALDFHQKLGFNMLHLLPLQMPGLSGSPYSIYDQMQTFNGETLQQISGKIRSFGFKAMTDVVWNHTACNTKWLREHPEATYCLQTAPHLKPAIELDDAFRMFSEMFESFNLDPAGETDQWIQEVLTKFKKEFFEPLKLWEYFVIDVESVMKEFSKLDPEKCPKVVTSDEFEQAFKKYGFKARKFGTRYRYDFHLEWCAGFLKTRSQNVNQAMNTCLNNLNHEFFMEYDKMTTAVFTNTRNFIHWHRIDLNGPRLGKVSSKLPLVFPYFTYITPEIAAANNGWLWNADVTVDFALNEQTYLRRDVQVWGDCVKLRYGNVPKDSLFLWTHMREYTVNLAKNFDALRIDNCHSTPIPVAKFMLRAARRVNPNLYILAELFTGNQDLDMEYCSKIGINSLLREAMQANNAGELCNFVSIYSNFKIGQFFPTKSKLHALFMDCTHDNEPCSHKRTVEDTLPNLSLVSMTNCAIGTTMCADLLVPRNMDIVKSPKIYPKFDLEMGILSLRKFFNDLHESMLEYTETHTDVQNDFVVVYRQNPKNYNGYVLIAKTFNLENTKIQINLQKQTFKCIFSKQLKKTGSCLESNVFTGFESKIKDLHVDSLTLEAGGGSVFVFETKVDTDAVLELNETVLNRDLIDQISLLDMNLFLFKCNQEENCYHVPNYGTLTYCGLKGLIHVIDETKDLNSPLCNNLREGYWLLDYTQERLKKLKIYEWIKSKFDLIKRLPQYLCPKYFCLIVKLLLEQATQSILNRLSSFSRKSNLTQQLSMVSIQLHGDAASLEKEMIPSLAAGLPHFSTGYMRCWGRDVFISLRGLFMLTGQFEVAKQHIISFAKVSKFGLIPNLMNSGNCRFNSRDAVWWFLQSVQDYCNLCSMDILKSNLGSKTLLELCREILELHLEGIKFTEPNAGPNLDHAMRPEGFVVECKIDSFGFVTGGNEFNCGTWMDKMGDSSNNYGIPATPRDGAAIELCALEYSCLLWMQKLTKLGVLKPLRVSFEHWIELIEQNFETKFFMTNSYRDVVGSRRLGADEQIRCNQFIAMVIAPNLFKKEHAISALSLGWRRLLGPLGLKTLDPNDLNYNGDYSVNANQNGYNYHQGPEWLWVSAYFLRACLLFKFKTKQEIEPWLKNIENCLSGPYFGLPELTNHNGSKCFDSCPTQAWSAACFLELCHDYY